MRCEQCACSKGGSVSMNCKNGKCKCKSGFRGTKCTDRDCVMSPWKWQSTCECGPGKSRFRSRHVVVAPHGNGKKCGILQERVQCGIKCQCAQHEFGPFCENRHCVVGPWSYPCNSMGAQDENECTLGTKIVASYSSLATRPRRKIIHEPRGLGRKCPKLFKDSDLCIVKACKTISDWFMG